jgi:hypothetical protein
MLVVLALGCGETLPPVDAAQVQRNVNNWTERVNAVSDAAAEQEPAKDLACAYGGESLCGVLEGLYGAVEKGVEKSHLAISLYAELGRGARATQLGIEALERALDRLVDEAERAKREVQHVVAGGDQGAGGVGGGEAGRPSSESEAGGDGAGAADGPDEREGEAGTEPPAGAETGARSGVAP